MVIKKDFNTKIAPYESYITKYSSTYGVPVNLVKEVIRQESGGNPNAGSNKNAGGLMQLIPETAKSLGVKNRFDPEQNIAGGVKYLAQQYQTFGRWDHALAAYNAGPGAVQKYKGIPPYKETQNYVKSILGKYGQVKETETIDKPFNELIKQYLQNKNVKPTKEEDLTESDEFLDKSFDDALASYKKKYGDITPTTLPEQPQEVATEAVNQTPENPIVSAMNTVGNTIAPTNIANTVTESLPSILQSLVSGAKGAAEGSGIDFLLRHLAENPTLQKANTALRSTVGDNRSFEETAQQAQQGITEATENNPIDRLIGLVGGSLAGPGKVAGAVSKGLGLGTVATSAGTAGLTEALQKDATPLSTGLATVGGIAAPIAIKATGKVLNKAGSAVLNSFLKIKKNPELATFVRKEIGVVTSLDDLAEKVQTIGNKSEDQLQKILKAYKNKKISADGILTPKDVFGLAKQARKNLDQETALQLGLIAKRMQQAGNKLNPEDANVLKRLFWVKAYSERGLKNTEQAKVYDKIGHFFKTEIEKVTNNSRIKLLNNKLGNVKQLRSKISAKLEEAPQAGPSIKGTLAGALGGSVGGIPGAVTAYGATKALNTALGATGVNKVLGASGNALTNLPPEVAQIISILLPQLKVGQ